jgi:hypothetical protein
MPIKKTRMKYRPYSRYKYCLVETSIHPTLSLVLPFSSTRSILLPEVLASQLITQRVKFFSLAEFSMNTKIGCKHQHHTLGNRYCSIWRDEKTMSRTAVSGEMRKRRRGSLKETETIGKLKKNLES